MPARKAATTTARKSRKAPTTLKGVARVAVAKQKKIEAEYNRAIKKAEAARLKKARTAAKTINAAVKRVSKPKKTAAKKAPAKRKRRAAPKA